MKYNFLKKNDHEEIPFLMKTDVFDVTSALINLSLIYEGKEQEYSKTTKDLAQILDKISKKDKNHTDPSDVAMLSNVYYSNDSEKMGKTIYDLNKETQQFSENISQFKTLAKEEQKQTIDLTKKLIQSMNHYKEVVLNPICLPSF